MCEPFHCQAVLGSPDSSLHRSLGVNFNSPVWETRRCSMFVAREPGDVPASERLSKTRHQSAAPFDSG